LRISNIRHDTVIIMIEEAEIMRENLHTRPGSCTR